MSAVARHAGAPWAVVLPVKPYSAGKTRLDLPVPLRSAVARALAMDTVAAAVACPGSFVVVVTDADPADYAALGALVVPDVPARGLNAALRYGLERAERGRVHPGGYGLDRPEWGRAERAVRSAALAGAAALCGDLPALRPDELAAVLAAVPPRGRAAVGDDAGTGTTLLAAAAGATLRPRFGTGSLSRHVADGAVDLSGTAGPGLRRDVDTLADLADAAAHLGLGGHTAALLEALRAHLPAPTAMPGTSR